MADSARITESFVELLVTPSSNARITESMIEILTHRYDVGTVLVVPDGLAPEDVDIPRDVQSEIIPDVPGAISPTATFGMVTVKFTGKVYAETDQELRDILDPFFNVLYLAMADNADPVVVQIFPGRYLKCRLKERTPHPRWPAVSGNLFQIDFTLVSTDGWWYDDSGYELWKTP